MRVEDAVALAKPWEFSRYFRKTDWTIEELVCEDNATYRSSRTRCSSSTARSDRANSRRAQIAQVATRLRRATAG